MRKFLLPLVAVATLAATAAVAHSDSKPEQAAEYRQSVFMIIGWNIGPIGAVVQGKAPYDKDLLAKQAARIAAVAPMALEGFPQYSATAKHTKAKPEIWQNWAEFEKLAKALETKSASFAEVAKSGDLAKIKPAFGELAQACKDCHEKFRAK